MNAANNTLLHEYSYDAWGRMRNTANLTTYSPGSEPVLFVAGRGFTGHEHLPWFNLINMNGRLYDPLTARFLSPDNYVQLPDFTQNFNRYSYCLNNPLIYSDPSGEFWHIIIGAIIGGVINTATHWKQIDNFWDGVAAFGIGAAAGAVGAATGGAAFVAAGGGAAGAGGFIAGFAGGAVGAVYSMPILSAGNSAYFGDPMMTPRQYAAGILTGGLLGGAVNGGIALIKGKPFLTGTPKPVPSNWQSPALRVDDPEINLNLDRPNIKSFPNPQEQQTFLRVETGDGNVQWIKIQQQDLTLSPRQSLHLGNNVGSSPLTVDPSRVLNDLNKGNFQFVQLNHRGMPIVKFNYPIGNVLQQGTGINLGSTYYGTVHINGADQIHVVPWLFR